MLIAIIIYLTRTPTSNLQFQKYPRGGGRGWGWWWWRGAGGQHGWQDPTLPRDWSQARDKTNHSAVSGSLWSQGCQVSQTQQKRLKLFTTDAITYFQIVLMIRIRIWLLRWDFKSLNPSKSRSLRLLRPNFQVKLKSRPGFWMALSLVKTNHHGFWIRPEKNVIADPDPLIIKHFLNKYKYFDKNETCSELTLFFLSFSALFYAET